MKKIKVDLLTLIGIVLILIGALGVIYYYSVQQSSECVRDPVAYANNNSDDYWWDFVTPINLDRLVG